MKEPVRTSSKISLVLADVDGTLVTKEKVLTQRAAAAVKAVMKVHVLAADAAKRALDVILLNGMDAWVPQRHGCLGL